MTSPKQPAAVIVAARRTPIGRAVRGSLASVRAEDLLATAVTGALDTVPHIAAADIDDVLVGTWLHVGDQGGNVARRLAVLLGWDATPGSTVNRACASSLQALRMATHAIWSGEGHAFVVAGVESVSHYASPRTAGATPDGQRHPRFLAAAERSRNALAATGSLPRWTDPRLNDEMPDVHLPMGLTAENVAAVRGVSRADQDAFALTSQQKAAASVSAGHFASEIVPVVLADGSLVVHDDSPRPDTTLEGLAALAPSFIEDGTVTAGNCSPLNDGAAALVVVSEAFATARGLNPLARVTSTGVSALSPEIMGLGPVVATHRALESAAMVAGDIDLIEINEAFAAQVLPCIDDLGLDYGLVNVNGGAIALGHPFGMGGARLVTTLIHAMQHRGRETGLVTMCAAGGQGMAITLRR